MSYGRGFEEPLALREAMNRLFEESFIQPTRAQRHGGTEPQTIPINIFQSGDNVVVFAPMPGLHPEDVEVNVANYVLHIRGHKRGPGEERRHFLIHEWTVGPYERSIPLPEEGDVNSARASFDNGALVVTFDRAEHTKPRRIPVQTGGE